MTDTILLVDDEQHIIDLAKMYLEREGYQVISAADGLIALDKIANESPNLIVLDLMLPGVDGWEICRRVRTESDVPIIMLTARNDDIDKIVGLELGADDYVTKPFGMAELVARIRAVLRRAAETPTVNDILRVGGVVVDKGTHIVRVDERKIDLTPSEFSLLTVLMTIPGQVFTRAQLLERLKGDENVERTIDVHIRNLRAKIEPDPSKPRYILTVFGVGYRFNDEGDER